MKASIGIQALKFGQGRILLTPDLRAKHHSRLSIVTLRSESEASLVTVDRHSPPSDQSITRDYRSPLSTQRSKHHSRRQCVTLRPGSEASLVTASSIFAQRVERHSRLVIGIPARRAKHHSRLSIVTLRPEIKASLAIIGRLSPPRDRSITRDYRRALRLASKASLAIIGRHSSLSECITRDWWLARFAQRLKHHS